MTRRITLGPRIKPRQLGPKKYTRPIRDHLLGLVVVVDAELGEEDLVFVVGKRSLESFLGLTV